MKTNPVGWFEIYVNDMARAKTFYESVLALSLEKMSTSEIDMLVFPMNMETAGASGALAYMPGFQSGGNSTLVYFTCEDCAIEEARVKKHGGRIHKPKTAIGEHGFITLAIDTEGNMFGLHSRK